MKCVNCGYEPTKGRPRKLDDAKVMEQRKLGMSLDKIAKLLGVSKGAIYASCRRQRSKV